MNTSFPKKSVWAAGATLIALAGTLYARPQSHGHGHGPKPKPHPTPTMRPTPRPEPTEAPEPTQTPEPTEAPEPTQTPEPTETPEPTATPQATATPRPTQTPRPTPAPRVNFQARLMASFDGLALQNPCTSETVTLSGAAQGTLHVVRDGAGRYHVQGHANTQGVSGVGTSGTNYQASGEAKLNTIARNGEFLVTTRFRLISQGASDNLKGVATFRVTIDTAAKTLTATLQSAKLSCQ